MSKQFDPFSDTEAISRYAEGALRNVPGYRDMQRMASILLSERAPKHARILVLGAGGGLELKLFAEAHPDWVLDGIDPSDEMLKLAQRTLGPHAPRVTLHRGYVDEAPAGPYDGATCLLTFHFMTLEERLHALSEVHRRLRPRAPFVAVHFSIEEGANRATWLVRFSEYAGISAEQVAALDSRLNILSPERDVELLMKTSFSNVALFYAGFTFRGWVAYA